MKLMLNIYLLYKRDLIPSLKFNGLIFKEEWKWNECFKSHCAFLKDDCKTVAFYEKPFLISQGTAGNIISQFV
jgi:hypothetical protein